MEVINSKARMSEMCSKSPRPLGLVPTMGFLHRGHLALITQAREENSTLAVSIFVNPTQFGPEEDYSSYPRNIERDLALLDKEGADFVFIPTVEEMYPLGFTTGVEVNDLSNCFEGEYRPTHFRGVATAVTKLFNIASPNRAYFGQKDGQQVAIIRRMCVDLDMEVEIIVAPTVRDPDGLAMSSRNVYLTKEQRSAATTLYTALCYARDIWAKGERNSEYLKNAVLFILRSEPKIDVVDYVSVVNSTTLQVLDQIEGSAMVLVAARIGKTRLIDNILLTS